MSKMILQPSETWVKEFLKDFQLKDFLNRKWV